MIPDRDLYYFRKELAKIEVGQGKEEGILEKMRKEDEGFSFFAKNGLSAISLIM